MASSSDPKEVVVELHSNDHDEPVPRVWWTAKTSNVTAAALLFATFVFSLGFMAIDTMAAPLLSDQLGIDIDDSANLFIAAGISSAVAYLVVYFIRAKKLCMLTKILFTSMLVLIISNVVVMDVQSWGSDGCQQWTCGWNPHDTCDAPAFTNASALCMANSDCNWMQTDCSTCPPICRNPKKSLNAAQLYTSYVLNNLAFTSGRITSGPLWSMMVSTAIPTGPHLDRYAPVKLWMQTHFETAGNLARVFGPMVATATYEGVKARTWLMGLVFAMTACVGGVWLFYTRTELVKIEDPQESQERSRLISKPDALLRPSTEAPEATPKSLSIPQIVALASLVIATNFAFGLPLPSLKSFVESSVDSDIPGFGESEEVYSQLVVAFSIGALVGAPLVSIIEPKLPSFRWSIMWLCATGCVGGVLCGMPTTIVMLWFGRFCIGVWMGGMNVVFRAYLVMNVSKTRHAEYFAGIAFFCALAWAISPATGSWMAKASPIVLNDRIRFDAYRWPGWIMSMTALVSLTLSTLL